MRLYLSERTASKETRKKYTNAEKVEFVIDYIVNHKGMTQKVYCETIGTFIYHVQSMHEFSIFIQVIVHHSYIADISIKNLRNWLVSFSALKLAVGIL